jgi:5-methyltetrahydropteroyltriglutamate--homocysteine methyltransferase
MQKRVAERAQPPFRADHVGSLLRPPELIRARAERASGALSADALAAAEDDAVRAAVRMQEEVGLRVATDGEFRRSAWLVDFMSELGGVSLLESGEVETVVPDVSGRIDLGSGLLFRVDGKVTLPKTVFAEAFSALTRATTSATPKQTIPSPSMLHYRSGRGLIDPVIYPDLAGFWDDLVVAYRAELRGLAGLGCTYLQLDDTSLAYVNDPRQREHIGRLGEDPERLHLGYVDAMNRVVADRPPGITVAVHLCRGNLRSHWMAEGSYEFVAEALFGGLQVDGFFLEYDDERSGGFEPLRFVPPGKVVVLGLVTTKRGVLESKADLKRRIDEAARFVDGDQLCLSPQCGFASVLEGNALSYDEQVAKLRLVVETADEVWG